MGISRLFSSRKAGLGAGEPAQSDSVPTKPPAHFDALAYELDEQTLGLISAESRNRPVFIFVPHQDDELLTLGCAILEVLRGDDADVHVVLCTRHSRSGVRNLLNDGQKNCPKCGGSHQHELSFVEFDEARNREFVDSCAALGVPRGNVHFHPLRCKETQMSVPEAKALISSYMRVFPEADVYTHAPWGPEIHWGNPWGGGQHCDHYALGAAARELKGEGAIRGDLALFVESYNQGSFEKAYGSSCLEEVIAQDAEMGNIEAAISSYAKWDPAVGRYAVGYHSVTSEFDALKQRPVSFRVFQSAYDKLP